MKKLQTHFRLILLGAIATTFVGQSLAHSTETKKTISINKRTYLIPMRDGVKLATDVYLQNGSGPFPAILARTPYDKKLELGFGPPRDATLFLAPSITQKGYAFVFQNIRGKFQSEGQLAGDKMFWGDGADGYDTIAWIGEQGWSNKKIATLGGSAMGMTQIALAEQSPPNLTCQHISVAGTSLFQNIIFRDGVLRKALTDIFTSDERNRAVLREILAHPTYDTYHHLTNLTLHWAGVNVPAVHIGGWFDVFTQATIDTFVGYQTRGGPKARGQQKLVIGPWDHYRDLQEGDVTFPANAEKPPNNLTDPWAWFDHWMKGLPNGIERASAVTYYVMGDTTDPKAPGNEWRSADRWPIAATETEFFLRANKALTLEKPTDESSLSISDNPQDPVPSLGGNQMLPAPRFVLPASVLNDPAIVMPGPRDQRPIEHRQDILLFDTTTFARPLEITGRARAVLFLSSDAPDTDLVIKLCDVYPDGRSLNFSGGVARARFRKSVSKPEMMTPGNVYEVPIDLWSTSLVINKGHHLRVQLSSSSYPEYEVNSNTDNGTGTSRVALNSIHLAGWHASRVILPIVRKTAIHKQAF